MLKRNWTLSGIVALALVACLAFQTGSVEAAKKKKNNTAGLFQKLDANNDGKISASEFATIKELQPKLANKKDKKISKRFQALDTNSDGFLSQEEFAKIGKKKKA
jgi:Ca2+-binding EF-hand superfamily protein